MLVYLLVLSATRPMTHIFHTYFHVCQRPGVVPRLEWLSFAGIPVAISTVGRPPSSGRSRCRAVTCDGMVAPILARWPALHGLSPTIRLVIEVVLGGAMYLSGAFVIFRSTSLEFLGPVRSAGSRRSTSKPCREEKRCRSRSRS
jgi:hypothetical protein